VYAAHLSSPDEDLEFELESLLAIDLGGPLPPEAETTQLPIVLLGRDLLSGVELAYNGPGGFFTLSV
jgi:hypothetical protein